MPLSVAFDLGGPVFNATCRPAVKLRPVMPKATICEDAYPKLAKDKIRFPQTVFGFDAI